MTGPSVLHLIRPQPPGEVGGADLHIADLAEEQIRSGVEVVVCHYGNPEYGELLRSRGIANLHVETRGLRWWLRSVRRQVRADRPVVIHSHGYESDYVATALRLLPGDSGARNAAFVISSHGFIRTGVKLRAMTLLNERCLRSAAAIITASEPEARRLERAGYPDVQYVANGVRKATGSDRGHVAEQTALPEHDAKVAYVGRLSPEKRPDLFLDLAATLAGERADVSFAVIGTGPLLAECRAAVEERGLSERIRFTGLRRDVPELLAGMDILVSCSDTEGTPRAVVEGMAAGLPVVATRVGGLPDLVGHEVNGLLVDPGSGSQLLDSVRLLLDDPDRARDLGAAGRRRAQERFGAADMWAEVNRVYGRAASAAWALPSEHAS
ncbi:glycosyltransferase family 4 protein [Streptomyces sp. NPDC057521]|uniref:glycosyltransferase family 4 protein n=1 Tax=Streptomyces sp. NPDC057521 TaxID=3346156 RepID=UPI0036CAE6A2